MIRVDNWGCETPSQEPKPKPVQEETCDNPGAAPKNFVKKMGPIKKIDKTKGIFKIWGKQEEKNKAEMAAFYELIYNHSKCFSFCLTCSLYCLQC